MPSIEIVFIWISQEKGDNTVNLFNRAVKDVARSNNVYKHVWLVFDKDDFPAENFDHTVELCEAEGTEETRYHPIWSNQCIELWFLLHFMFLQSDLHRDEYWPKLSECLKARNQSFLTDLFCPILPRFTAISNPDHPGQTGSRDSTVSPPPE